MPVAAQLPDSLEPFVAVVDAIACPACLEPCTLSTHWLASSASPSVAPCGRPSMRSSGG